MIRLRSILVGGLAWLPAVAAAAPSVVLEVAGDESALEAPLRAELADLGFEVVETPGADADAVIRAAEASLVLSLAPTDGGYEIWLRDRGTEETLLREVVEATESSVSLAVVERVRASLLEIRDREAPPAAPPTEETSTAEAEAQAASAPAERPARPAAPTPAPPVPAPTSPYLRIADDLISTDRTVAGTVEAGAVWMYESAGGHAIGVELAGGPFSSRNGQARFIARYHNATALPVRQGHADLYTAQLGVAAALHIVDPTAPISPFVELGAFGTLVHFDATTPAGALVAREESHVTIVPFLGTGLTAGVPDFPLRFRFATGLGVAVPELRFMEQGEPIASYGHPQLFATFSTQYAFFAD